MALEIGETWDCSGCLYCHLKITPAPSSGIVCFLKARSTEAKEGWEGGFSSCSAGPLFNSHPSCSCPRSEAAAHAVATLAEATLQGGGQIVLSGETAAAVGALTGVQDANGKRA